MRIARYLFSLVVLVFATTALYMQGQYIWHNRTEYGLWETTRMQFVEAYPIIIPAVVVIIAVLVIEYLGFRQDSKERNRDRQLLEAIARKLGVDINDIDTKSK